MSLSEQALTYVESLEAAGVPTPQARAHGHALATLLDQEIATKSDLERLRLQLEARISESETRLTRWVLTAGVLQTGIIVTLMLRFLK
jgi:hypothetical protein